MSDSDREMRSKLEAAFSNLPWIQREVFKLHRIENFSYAEVAWLMCVSERFVERQMAKAIYKLVKQMDGEKLSWWERLL